jgi:hypothetical protein
MYEKYHLVPYHKLCRSCAWRRVDTPLWFWAEW